MIYRRVEISYGDFHKGLVDELRPQGYIRSYAIDKSCLFLFRRAGDNTADATGYFLKG